MHIFYKVLIFGYWGMLDGIFTVPFERCIDSLKVPCRWDSVGCLIAPRRLRAGFVGCLIGFSFFSLSLTCINKQ